MTPELGPCPPIEELTRAPDLEADVREHAEQCTACGAVVTICALRRPERPAAGGDGECVELEPLLAAMVDGTIDERQLPELVAHLQRCASCNEVLASLSLLGEELGNIPEPAVKPPAQWLARGARALMPRRPWQWALQLAAAVLVGVVFASWLGGRQATEGQQVATSVPDPKATGQRAAPGGPCGRAGSSASSDEARVEDPWIGPTSRSSGRPKLDGIVDPWTDAPARERERERDREGVVDPWHVPSRDAATPDTATDQAKTPGRLSVACRRVCRVIVDGRTVGNSPVAGLQLAPGKHTVVLLSEGRRKALSVMITAGETTKLVVDMEQPAPQPDDGYLSVNCLPYGEVIVDGKAVGYSPIARHPLTAGEHTLVCRRGQQERRRQIVIRPGQSLTLSVHME